MIPENVTPIAALAAIDPRFLDSLSPVEAIALASISDAWLRPDQHIPRSRFRYCGFVCGRGYGKTTAIAHEINRRVEDGEARHVGLVAPTDDRVEEVQIATLIATSPPWFRPERYRGGLIWPNGVQAVSFTPLAPGRSRSENLELTWLTEIVDWNHHTRLECFNNVTTATRVGAGQVLWDTTSKGKNDVIQHLVALNAEDPETYPIIRGTMFDNPLLSETYIKAECRKYSGRAYSEEVEGNIHAESAGALWHQAWIDDSRVLERPGEIEYTLVSIDPALSAASDADETGLVHAARGRDSHAYILEDMSKRYAPEQWGDIAVDLCARGAAGCVIERNHLGDNAVFVLRSRATARGLVVRILDKDKPFPRRTPGVIYVRELISRASKSERASGAASEMEQGRAHLVGTMSELELELTTWEPGTGQRSPGRLDAAAQAITEIRELALKETREKPNDNARRAAAAHDRLKQALRAKTRRVGH